MYNRPIIISIEDDRDYHADIVLATLLDDSAPPPTASHPRQTTPTSSSVANATAAVSTSTSPQRLQSETATKRDHDVHMEEEGEVDFEHEPENATGSRPGLAGRRSRPSHHGSAAKGLQKRTSDLSVAFPSGSQFRRGSSRRPGNVQKTTHIPPPPAAPHVRSAAHSSSTMDMPSSSHNSRHVAQDPNLSGSTAWQSNPAHSSTPKAPVPLPVHASTSSKPDPEAEDYDVMDALFGEDNMDAVAEDGQMFGFELQADGRSNTMDQGLTPPNTTSNRMGAAGGNGSQMDRTAGIEAHMDKDGGKIDEFATSPPLEDSFLPGTPPSKKVRLCSRINIDVLCYNLCSFSSSQHLFCLGWTCLVAIFTTQKSWLLIQTMIATHSYLTCHVW